jgi:molybdopterin synthase catalytic subunit
VRRTAQVAAACALVCLLTLLAAPAAQAAPSVTFQCSPAPADCLGWYRANVTITWAIQPSDATRTGCANETYTADTPPGGTDAFCRAVDTNGQATTVELKIRRDATPPVVTGGQPARAADADGWYNRAVGLTFAGSDLTSGIDSCTSTTYGGPDSASASVAGTCVDHAGNVGAPLSYGLKYDATAPTVAAAQPERQANENGWFNRAVAFDVQGSDATSGVADCPPVTYSGPDSATATFMGSCRDRAGNSAARSFALKYDATAPAATAAQAARGADANGWYNHGVGVSFSGSDQLSGIDRCTAATYSGPDSGTASLPGTCTDRAGNVSPALAFGLKYDATKPVVSSGQPDRASDSNGWYNRSVAVAFSGTDQTAGVEACTSATYAGPDSGTASLSGTCRDRAGNTSDPFGYGLKYDATAPQVTAADADRPADANGWYNRPVGFTIRGSDATSGIATCPSASYSGADSATATFTGTCRDTAGNVSSRAFGLQYDHTAPTVTKGTAARTADVGGWYNRPVAVAFEGTDAVSGVSGCSTPTYAGPDSTAASAAGTCTDRAGNVGAPLAYPLKYDATAPTVTGGTPGRAADSNGWYNRPVAVAFAGTDQTAGIESCTSATYDGADSATASVAGSCTDKAGNTSGPFGYGLKYDAAAPQVTAADPDRPADANGWFNRPVGFTIRGTDATSGIAACPAATYSGPDAAAATITGTCRDVAGNAASRAFALQYDDTAPAATKGVPARVPDVAGWYNRPVAIAFEGTDGLSGLSGCTTVTYSGPDSTAAGPAGTCTDRAGNVSAPLSFALKYDASAPTVTAGTPARAADANGWYNHAVAVTFSGTDPVSGVASCTSATYDGADSATASLAGTCTDKAGNGSGPFGFGLKYDETAPQVTAGTPRRGPDVAGWYNRAVVFDFAGADATSGIAACPSVTYSGPDGGAATLTGRCTDRAGNGTDRGFGLSYDATAPAVTSANPDRPPDAGGWYNRPVTVGFGGSDAASGVDACTTKTYPGPDTAAVSVTGTCTDKAGNVSGDGGLTIKYDATSPAVTGGQAARVPDAAGWYNRAVPIAFAGTDAMSGVDACTALTYGGPDSATASVPGTCRDKAGNVSPPAQFGLKYDETAPTVTGAQPERPPDHGSWFASPVRFTFTGTDAMSGLEICLPVDYTGPDGAGELLVGRCRDRAGNAGTRNFTLDYDATPPALSLSAESGDGSVALSWQTSPDATSVTVVRTPGVGGRPSSVVFTGPGTSFVDGLVDNGTRYAYDVQVADAAGNASTQSVVGFPAAPPLETESSFSAVPGVVAPGPSTTSPPKRPALAPAAGSVFPVTAPPLLRWPTARRADYYNVQLFRGKRKLLSVWPVRPRYQLEHSWKFRGKPRRLVAGTYRWMVWPGYGRRTKARYGKPIVRSTFVIQKVPR